MALKVRKPVIISEFANSSGQKKHFRARIVLCDITQCSLTLTRTSSTGNSVKQNNKTSNNVDELSSLCILKADAARLQIFNESILRIKPYHDSSRQASVNTVTTALGTMSVPDRTFDFAQERAVTGKGLESEAKLKGAGHGGRFVVTVIIDSPPREMPLEAKFDNIDIGAHGDMNNISEAAMNDSFANSQPKGLCESDMSRRGLSDHGSDVSSGHCDNEDRASTRPMKRGELTESRSHTVELPFADQLHLSPIYSTHYNTSLIRDDLLTYYFYMPSLWCYTANIWLNVAQPCLYRPSSFERYKSGENLLLHVGDVFQITSPVDFSDIYFKVQSMLPSDVAAGYADNRHTTLYLDGAVQSFIPSSLSSSSYLLNTAVFRKYSSEICRFMLPFINGCGRTPQGQGLYPLILLTGPTGCGKTVLSKFVTDQLHMHSVVIHCSNLIADTAVAFEAKLKQSLKLACTYRPCILLLKSIDLISKDRMGQDDLRVASILLSCLRATIDEQCTPSTVAMRIDARKMSLSCDTFLVIATTTNDKLLSTELRHGFLHHIEIKTPNVNERHEMIQALLLDNCVVVDVDASLIQISQRTAGMVLGDLMTLLSLAQKCSKERTAKCCHQFSNDADEEDKAEEDEGEGLRRKDGEDECVVKLTAADFDRALDQLQSSHADSIGAPKVPSVSWSDVGGLEGAKRDILDTIQLSLQHPELIAAGLSRSGILLHGPPGTGKTLLAKAIATECNINFLSVKGPELLNMYVGQSEENVREVFSRASSAAPCVIFFDELDSLAPNRGRSGDSGGVMDRVVSQLLAELDGLQKTADVFVIGATNRPDLIDPALLRPGRFDKLVHLGVSSDRKSQESILKALTRKFKLSVGCTLDRILDRCEGRALSGADLYAICSDALLNAVDRTIQEHTSAGLDANEAQFEVSATDFDKALDSLVVS